MLNRLQDVRGRTVHYWLLFAVLGWGVWRPWPAAASELSAQIERAARRVRMETYDRYRTQRPELDRRLAVLADSLAEWERRGRSEADGARLLNWLEQTREQIPLGGPFSAASFSAASPEADGAEHSGGQEALSLRPAPSPIGPSRAQPPGPARRPTLPDPGVRTTDGGRPGNLRPRPDTRSALAAPPPHAPVPRATSRADRTQQPAQPGPVLLTEQPAGTADTTASIAPAQPAPTEVDRNRIHTELQGPLSVEGGPPAVQPQLPGRRSETPTRRLAVPAAAPVERTAATAPRRTTLAAAEPTGSGAPLPAHLLPPSAPLPAAVRTGPEPIEINRAVLSQKLARFNSAMEQFEANLSLVADWDLDRLRAAGEELQQLLAEREHLQIFLDILPDDEQRLLMPMNDAAVALARFTQRMFEVRIQYSERSRRGDITVPLDWDESLQQIRGQIDDWTARQR